MTTYEELNQRMEALSALFARRMRQIHGDGPEFQEWLSALEAFDRCPSDAHAKAALQEALFRMLERRSGDRGQTP